jgi:hypothetical protein
LTDVGGPPASTAFRLGGNRQETDQPRRSSLGVRFAFQFALVALASAVSSTTTLFVFVLGVLLSWIAPTIAGEDLSKINLSRKGVAAAIASIGVVLAS